MDEFRAPARAGCRQHPVARSQWHRPDALTKSRDQEALTFDPARRTMGTRHARMDLDTYKPAKLPQQRGSDANDALGLDYPPLPE